MVLGVHITRADVRDQYGGMYLLRKVASNYPRLEKVGWMVPMRVYFLPMLGTCKAFRLKLVFSRKSATRR